MMVDALIGVAIIALVISVCMATLQATRRLNSATTNTHQATVLLSVLMDSTPRVPGEYSGISGDLKYDVKVKKQATATSEFCQIDAEAERLGEAHIYRLSGTRWCAETSQ